MSRLQMAFLVGPAGLMLLWLILAAFGPRKVTAPNVIVVLRYGPVLRTLALILALFPPMVMIYVIAVFPWKTDAALAYAGSAFAGTCVMAGLALIEVSRGQVLITDDGITALSPWRSVIGLHWTEVQRIGYSGVNSSFVVSGAGHRLRVSRYLVGIQAFADTVKRKLGSERYASAASALDAIR